MSKKTFDELEELPDSTVIPRLVRNPYYCNIEINTEAIEKLVIELERIQKKFMRLLDNDKEFLDKIVEKSLLICTDQGVYINAVNKMIWDRYPNIVTDPKLKAEGKPELLTLIYKLVSIIIGENMIFEKEIANIPDEEYDNYEHQFREIIEEKVREIFNLELKDESSDESCDIIGDIIE